MENSPQPVNRQSQLVTGGVGITARFVCRGHAAGDEAGTMVPFAAECDPLNHPGGEERIRNEFAEDVQCGTGVQHAVLHAGPPAARIGEIRRHLFRRGQITEFLGAIVGGGIVVEKIGAGVKQLFADSFPGGK